MVFFCVIGPFFSFGERENAHLTWWNQRAFVSLIILNKGFHDISSNLFFLFFESKESEQEEKLLKEGKRKTGGEGASSLHLRSRLLQWSSQSRPPTPKPFHHSKSMKRAYLADLDCSMHWPALSAQLHARTPTAVGTSRGRRSSVSCPNLERFTPRPPCPCHPHFLAFCICERGALVYQALLSWSVTSHSPYALIVWAGRQPSKTKRSSNKTT